MKRYKDTNAFVLDDFDIRLPDRSGVTNKGDCGRLLVVGGDVGMAGAVCFAAESAYRSGSGLVEVLTHSENRIPIQTLIPEAIASFWDGWDVRKINSYSAVTVGVGLGKGETARRLLERILSSVTVPTVIDADALNIISDTPELMSLLGADTVLTPHMMEFSRLSGLSVAEIKSNPITVAEQFAKNYGINLVLKDKETVIAMHDGSLFVNTTGDSTLSKGGSGDILAGLIGSFFAQKMTSSEAIPFAVWLHGKAGERAGEKYGQRGALARDVIKELAFTIKDF